MAEPLPHLLIFDHAFSSDLVPGFAGDSCDLHIRTLSTILYNMQQADPPKGSRKDVPSILRHIAILLTRGTDIDGETEAKHAVAVTATSEESSLKLLIVPQNSPNARQNDFEPFKLSITTIKRNSRTLEEIYNGYRPIVFKKSTNIHIESLASALLKASMNTSQIFSGSSSLSIQKIGKK